MRKLKKISVWDEPAPINPVVDTPSLAEATDEKKKRKKKKKRAFELTEEDAYDLGERIGIEWESVDFDIEALQKGYDVELEHGDLLGEDTDVTQGDPEATAKIAWAHLKEDPEYYEKLEKYVEGDSEKKTAQDLPGLDEPWRPTKKELPKQIDKDKLFEMLRERSTEPEEEGDPEPGNWRDIAADEFIRIEDLGDAISVEDQAEILDLVELMLFDVENPSEEHVRDVVDQMVQDFYDEKDPLELEGGPNTVEERPGVYSYAGQDGVAVKAVIRKCKKGDSEEGKPWCLYDHVGDKLLGRHPSKASARKQEAAIKANASNSAPDNDESKSCNSVGDRKRSDGKGRGKGRGKGKGPLGVPVGEKEGCWHLEQALDLIAQEDWREDWSPSGPSTEWDREEQLDADPGPDDTVLVEISRIKASIEDMLPKEMRREERAKIIKFMDSAIALFPQEASLNRAIYAAEYIESIMYDDFPDIAPGITDAAWEFVSRIESYVLEPVEAI